MDRIIFYKNGKYNLNYDKIQKMDDTKETICEKTLSFNTPKREEDFLIISNPINNNELKIQFKYSKNIRICNVSCVLISETSGKKQKIKIIDPNHCISSVYITNTNNTIQKMIIP